MGCAWSSFCWLSSVVPVDAGCCIPNDGVGVDDVVEFPDVKEEAGAGAKENLNELPDADDGVVDDPKEKLTGVGLFVTGGNNGFLSAAGVGISPVGSAGAGAGAGLDPNTKLVEEADGLAASGSALFWTPNRAVLVLVLVLVFVLVLVLVVVAVVAALVSTSFPPSSSSRSFK